jgi:hypothetical protein
MNGEKVDKKNNNFQYSGFKSRDKAKPKIGEVIPPEREEGVPRVQIWINKFLQEGDVENLIKGAKMVAMDSDGEESQSEKKELAMEGMAAKMFCCVLKHPFLLSDKGDDLFSEKSLGVIGKTTKMLYNAIVIPCKAIRRKLYNETENFHVGRNAWLMKKTKLPTLRP